MNKKLLMFFLGAVLVLGGCSHDHEHEDEVHEHGGTSVTLYTDSTEIFMEYPSLIVNEEARFLIHMTRLKDFKAVTEGKLEIEFINNKGESVSAVEDRPTRDGIYIPVIKFSEPGIYRMIMTLAGSQVSDTIIVDNVRVYSTDEEVPHEEEEGSEGISFLKEQQWKIDFRNEPVKKRIMQNSVLAAGEIQAKPENFSIVTAPSGGIILNKNNRNIKTPGSHVAPGELLLVISPSGNTVGNFQNIRAGYQLAKSEYERTERLFEKGAVSKKRLEEAKLEYETNKSAYNSLSNQIEMKENGYSVLASIEGYIEKINFRPGDQVAAGQELYTIVNPARLILKANVPSSRLDAALNSKDALFKIEGLSEQMSVSLLNGRKVSVAAGLDESSRTLPVYYEFDNPQNKIKIGMYAEVYIKAGEENEYLAIPESAVVDEDGLHTAYVQTEGESFEKRIIKTGINDGEYVQVLEGLKEGERVVTEGAYQIRLAALAPEAGLGHGHAH